MQGYIKNIFVKKLEVFIRFIWVNAKKNQYTFT